MKTLIIRYLLLLITSSSSDAFTTTCTRIRGSSWSSPCNSFLKTSKQFQASLLQSSFINEQELELIANIKAMRVRELKSKLESVGINTSDAFEKDELVKRLVDYSMQNNINSIPDETTQSSTTNSTVKKKKKKKKLNTPPPDIITENEPLQETTSNVQSSVPNTNNQEMKKKQEAQ